jgi:hypothetical protein
LWTQSHGQWPPPLPCGNSHEVSLCRDVHPCLSTKGRKSLAIAPALCWAPNKWLLPGRHSSSKTGLSSPIALFFCLFFFYWYMILLCSQAKLELEILLPQPPECWDYRCETSHPSSIWSSLLVAMGFI